MRVGSSDGGGGALSHPAPTTPGQAKPGSRTPDAPGGLAQTLEDPHLYATGSADRSGRERGKAKSALKRPRRHSCLLALVSAQHTCLVSRSWPFAQPLLTAVFYFRFTPQSCFSFYLALHPNCFCSLGSFSEYLTLHSCVCVTLLTIWAGGALIEMLSFKQ